MAIHSSVLAWRIPGTGEPGGLPSVGSHRVGHDWSDLAAACSYHPTFKIDPDRWLPEDGSRNKKRHVWPLSVPAFTSQSFGFSISLQVFLHVPAGELEVLPTCSIQENADEGSGQGYDYFMVLVCWSCLVLSKYMEIFWSFFLSFKIYLFNL